MYQQTAEAPAKPAEAQRRIALLESSISIPHAEIGSRLCVNTPVNNQRFRELMAAQAKMVGKAKGAAGQGRPKKGGLQRNPTNDAPPTQAEAGIDKNLAKAARAGLRRERH